MCDNVISTEEKQKKARSDMTVIGCYTRDDNFTTVFSNDVMYTIARNTGEWGSVRVGGTFANGQPFTKADYERFKGECDSVGTFVLD
jgi:hypothetical protein